MALWRGETGLRETMGRAAAEANNRLRNARVCICKSTKLCCMGCGLYMSITYPLSIPSHNQHTIAAPCNSAAHAGTNGLHAYTSICSALCSRGAGLPRPKMFFLEPTRTNYLLLKLLINPPQRTNSNKRAAVDGNLFLMMRLQLPGSLPHIRTHCSAPGYRPLPVCEGVALTTCGKNLMARSCTTRICIDGPSKSTDVRSHLSSSRRHHVGKPLSVARPASESHFKRGAASFMLLSCRLAASSMTTATGIPRFSHPGETT